MILWCDPESPLPPFEQIRAQLTQAIQTGALEPDERLPPIRQLAGDLGLAINTVARAYRELEIAGLVESRGRRGTFVLPEGGQHEQARLATRDFTARMRRLGIGKREMVAFLRRELESGGPDAVGSEV